MLPCRTGRGSHRDRIALEVQNIVLEDGKSVTYMATVWWTSLFRWKAAMTWSRLVAPNPTTSFPREAGSVFLRSTAPTEATASNFSAIFFSFARQRPRRGEYVCCFGQP